MAITTPEYITLENWTADLNISVPQLVVPTLMQGQSWWDWANDLISINKLTNIVIPDRQSFPLEEDWRKWAYTLIQSIQKRV